MFGHFALILFRQLPKFEIARCENKQIEIRTVVSRSGVLSSDIEYIGRYYHRGYWPVYSDRMHSCFSGNFAKSPISLHFDYLL